MSYRISYSCLSNIGKVRSMNQDNFICNGVYSVVENTEAEFPLEGSVTSKTPTLFGVFDGMGGEQCGEIAAYIAAKEAKAVNFSKNSVRDLIEYCKKANSEICRYAEENSISAMGTTAAMILFTKKVITLCNVGDSRIFRFSQGELKQISKDHVVISAYGTKPPLSQNLGIPESVLTIEPYLSQGGYRNGDRYLICSDGLTDMLTTDEIAEILSGEDISIATETLLEGALDKGGKDNITVILLEIKSSFKNLFYKDKSNGGTKL